MQDEITYLFLNFNGCTIPKLPIKISLKFVPKGQINNIGSDNDSVPSRQ